MMQRVIFCSVFLFFLFTSSQGWSAEHISIKRDSGASSHIKRTVFGATTGNIIKVGRTHSLYGGSLPYSNESNSYLDFAINYINQNVGVTLNGTAYQLQQITYESASDCQLIGILYQRLAEVDKVHIFLDDFTVGTCVNQYIQVNLSGIPMVAAGEYDEFLVTPTGYEWVFNVLPNPATLALPCMSPFSKAGVQTAVISVVTTLAGYGSVSNITAQILNPPIKILAFDILDESQVSSPNYLNYMTPYVQKYQALKPDLMITGANPTDFANFMDAFRANFFDTKGFYHTSGLDISTVRDQIDWQGYGGTVTTGFDPNSYNFSDPFFGNSQNYAQLFFKTFGVVASNLDAFEVTSVVVAVKAIMNANSLDPEAIRNVLINFNESTILGQVGFTKIGSIKKSPNFCFQFLGKGEYHPLNNSGLPNSIPLYYPWNFVTDPTYEYDHTPRTIWERYHVLILCLVIIVPIATVFFVLLGIYLYRTYYFITIPKEGVQDTWGQ